MKIDQKLFLEVPLNSNDRNPCSPPAPAPDWRGIVIQAPEKVTFKRDQTVDEYGAFAAIPVCGYCQLDVLTEPWPEPMRLFAVDRATGTVYSGDVVELDPSPEKPPPEDEEPLTPEEVEGLATGTYFNPNLADFVQLPQKPAIYNIYVEFREVRSNMVAVEIVEAK